MASSHNAMDFAKRFVQKSVVSIVSLLSCFDRVVFKGYLPFLGRKLNGNFQGEVLSSLTKGRLPGARVKHWVKENWLKMYDKFGLILRVETVINLRREPRRLSWTQSTAPLRSWSVERRPGAAVLQHRIDYGRLDWLVRAAGESLEFEIRQDAWAPVYDLALVLNLNQAHCPTAVLPHAVEDHVRLIPPWLFVAPDHGHLDCELIPGVGAKKTVRKGVSAVTDAPNPWFSTLVGRRRSHTLMWTLRSRRPFEKGDAVMFRFSPQPIAKPDGVDRALWRRVRRPRRPSAGGRVLPHGRSLASNRQDPHACMSRRGTASSRDAEPVAAVESRQECGQLTSGKCRASSVSTKRLAERTS